MARPSEQEIEATQKNARALIDELYQILSIVEDRQAAYIAAMQILLARSGLEPAQVFDGLATLVSHNLFDDAPIQLAVIGSGDETLVETKPLH